MAAPDNAKLQANFKWDRDGSMINVYASSQEEFEQLLTTVQDTATLFISVEQTLKGLARINGVAVSQPAATQAPVQAAPAPAGAAPTCAHGPMVFIKGVNAKGPWSGHKCPAPNGTPGKCQTIFNRN